MLREADHTRAWNRGDFESHWIHIWYEFYAKEHCTLGIPCIILCSLLQPEFQLLYKSPPDITLASLKKVYPLYCLSSHHDKTTYKWMIVDRPDHQFPSTPVLHVRKAGLYKCTATCGLESKSEVFAVQLKPTAGM